MKKRLWYAGVFVLLLGVECLIALYVRDRFIRPYVGDMLVTVGQAYLSEGDPVRIVSGEG